MTVKHTLVSLDMRVFALCSLMELHRNGRTAAIGDSKAVTLDLNGHTLILDTISSGNNLTIANGNYKGKITNGGVGLTKELTFKNAKAALNDLQWMTNNG